MDDNECLTFNDLVLKVQQHEETITQLVEIIAVTNRRLSELYAQEHNKEHNFSFP
ncbi:hypothetical protein ACFQ3N_10805 [Virgibacillus byunsanensis]|uniref:Degradation enzyme regulation protein DegQ n=1 Tax=Virgibacillus byunsanensis TaxID=570945 RepID=A0ABW3LNN7_9BACI